MKLRIGAYRLGQLPLLEAAVVMLHLRFAAREKRHDAFPAIDGSSRRSAGSREMEYP